MKVKQIFNSAVLRKVATVSSATFLSTLIPLIAIPLLVKFYSPEAFGKTELFTSISMFLFLFASLKTEVGMVKAGKDELRVNLWSYFWFSSSICLMFQLIFFLIDAVVYPLGIFTLIPSLSWGTAVYQGTYYSLVSSEKFRQVAYLKISTAIIITSIKFILPTAGYSNENGLIYATICGQIFCGLSGYLVLVFKESYGFIPPSYMLIKSFLIKFREFVIHTAPQQLTTLLKENIVIYLISIFYGEKVLGFYAMGLKLLKAPIFFVGGAIQDVFYQRFSTLNPRSAKHLSDLLKLSLVAASLCAAVLALSGPSFFSRILGPEWGMSGQIAGRLGFWYFFYFLILCFGVLPISLGRQKISFGMKSFVDLLGTGSFFIACLMGLDALDSFFILGAVVGIGLFTYNVVFLKLLRDYEESLASP